MKAAAIIEYGSYRIALHGMGGAFALTLIMVFFWMPESAYTRKALNIDTGETTVSILLNTLRIFAKIGKISVEEKATLEQLEHSPTNTREPTQSETPISWAKQLLPYSGYVNNVSLLNTLIRPFYLVASPAVLWAIILFTTCISWLVGVSLTLSQIFSAPPYNFSVVGVGATNLSSFVASFLGTLTAGPMIDGLVSKMSKMNGGIFGIRNCPHWIIQRLT